MPKKNSLIVLLACTTIFFALTTAFHGRQLAEANGKIEYIEGERDACYLIFKLAASSAKAEQQKREEQRRLKELRRLDIREKVLDLRPTIQARYLDQITDSIDRYSAEQRLDPDLIISLIYIESRFNPLAISPVGAKGLTQVMPLWVNQLEYLNHENDLFDIDTNIRAGTEIYRQYLDLYNGNEELALLAYNRGPHNVNKDLKRNRDPRNGYAVAVLTRYKKLGD